MIDRKRDVIIIAMTFLVIFLFVSIDNVVSPLVDLLDDFYLVDHSMILSLISSCTLGIAVGVFIGPLISTNLSNIKILLSINVILMLITTLIFIFFSDIYIAIVARFLFGLSAGFLSSIFWTIAFHGVSSSETTSNMIVSIMSSRPVALAIGVPILGYLSTIVGHKISFAIFASLIVIFGLILSLLIKVPSDNLGSSPVNYQYFTILKLKCSIEFYLGIVINSMCYLGFYAIAGVWFVSKFNLSTEQTSALFVFFGISEVISSIICPKILTRVPYQFFYIFICAMMMISFSLFITGTFGLLATILLIMFFIIFTRFYIFINVQSIPLVFKNYPHKGTLGSLITLSAWIGFSIISLIQTNLLLQIGLNNISLILVGCLILSLYLSFRVQNALVFKEK